MKTTFCHIRALSALTAVAAAAFFCISCSSSTTLDYDQPGSISEEDGNNGHALGHPSEVSVAYLRSLALGLSTPIDRPLSIMGYVTANDFFGELYKSIHIEDATGGIDVEIDSYALYTRFALYDRVRVECHGLSLGRYGSSIQLGMPPTGEYTVDRIPVSEIGRYLTAGTHTDDKFTPAAITADSLTPSLAGRTVKIGGLHMSEADRGLSWCDIDPLSGAYTDTERTVADDSGTELRVIMRGGCTYAGEPVPDGRFELCGIVEYRSGACALRITNRNINMED